jgi:hypothetical protein
MHASHPNIHCIGLLLGLVLSGFAFAGGEESLLQVDLTAANQRIGEAEIELQEALARFDQAALTEVGRRLRDLKLRQLTISRKLAEVSDRQRRADSAELARQRPGIARQLEAIQPQVQEAAAAFAEHPTPAGGARLRALSAQEIELKANLAAADAAAIDADSKDKATAGTAPK